MDTIRKSTVKEYFSTNSGYWNSLYSDAAKHNFLHYELTRRKDVVFELVSGIKDDKLRTALDLGCGAGQYLAQLAEMELECVGADISEDMLNLAKQKIDPRCESRVTLVNTDCYDLPMESNSFDLILCIGLLEYLDSETSALKEIRRVVSPEGHVIITLPNLYKLRNLVNPYYYLIRGWRYFIKRPASRGGAQNQQKFDFSKTEATRYSLPKAKRLMESFLSEPMGDICKDKSIF